MPQLTINNSVTVTNTAASQLNILTVAGPQGPIGPASAGGGSTTGVVSVNGLTGILSILTSGNNLNIRPVGSNLYIDITGASNVSDVLYTSGEQSITGLKTFYSGIKVVDSGTNSFFLNIGGRTISMTGYQTANGESKIDFYSKAILGPDRVSPGSSTQVINWNDRALYATGDKGDGTQDGLTSVAWADRKLYTDRFINSVDWNERILSGEWHVMATGDSPYSVINKWMLDTTGSLVNSRINALSGYTTSIDGTLATSIAVTGSTLDAKINGLSGFTIAASGALQTLIVGVSGTQVKVSGSSTLSSANFSGAGSVTIIQSGSQVLVSGASFVTQAQLDSASGFGIARDNAISGVLDTRLALTGSGLYSLVTGMSGQSVTDYATKTNLALTGSSIYTTVVGLSGAFNTQIASTGNQAWSATNNNGTNLSGALANSGTALSNRDFLISGILSSGLAITGSGLYGLITGASGQANANFATIANLALTGSGLYTLVTGLSGQANTNYVTVAVLASTGSQTWNAANNNGINLSGNLTATGSTLYNLTTALSGQATSTYATIANLALTGSGLYRTITGMSGALVALIGASAAGVASINGASGVLNLQGAGSVSVTTAGQTITVSGDTGIYSTFALKTDLGTTGTTLLARDLLTSGILSSGLAQTGSNLYALVTGLSGQAISAYATVSNLALTGSGLYTSITGLSGAFNTVIALTGSQAWNAANSNATNLSGNLTSSGVLLTVRDTLISGILTTGDTVSGAALYNLIVAMSGQDVINFATKTNLMATGTLLSAVQVTGSSIINIANFTGLGSTQVLYSGNTIFVSGSAGGGGGVTSLNSLAGAVTLTAGPGINIASAGQTLTVSGDYNSLVYTSGNQTITGPKVFVSSGAFATTTGRNNLLDGDILLLQGDDGKPTRFVVDTYNSTNTFGSSIRGRRARGQSNAPTAVQTSDNMLQLAADGYHGSGFASAAASISMFAATPWYSGNSPTYIAFRTTVPFSGASQERMRINTSGELTIGDPVNISILSTNPLAIGGSGVSLQANIKNLSTAPDGSSDWVATSNVGSDISGYINLGINGSAYSQAAFAITATRDGYLYVDGGNLVIGTATTGNNILFHTAGTLTGNLRATIDDSGINLVASGDYRINNVSIMGTIRATGQAAWISANGAATTLSGNTTSTGIQLGATIASSGQQAWTAANTNAVILSGNATQSGVQLYNLIIGMSGQDVTNYATKTSLTASGTLLSVVQVTGSSIINVVNFTGINGLGVIYSGTQIFISGNNVLATGSRPVPSANFTGIGTTVVTFDGNFISISGAPAGTGAGVANINGVTNTINLIGTGGLQVSNVGGNFYLSGLNTTTGTQVVFMNRAGILSGDNTFLWDETNDTLAVVKNRLHTSGISVARGDFIALGTGVIVSESGAVFRSNGLAGDGTLYLTGVAAYPVAAIMQSGIGRSQSLLGPAMWSKQFTAIVPQTSNAVTVYGNTSAAVGTLTTVSTEALGQYTNYASAAAVFVAAGAAVTTPYYFRGSVVGRNGFFFSTTFSIADGNNITGAYGATSGSRFFIGMTDQSATASIITNDPAGNRVGLSYIAASGGTQTDRYDRDWLISAKDNSTQFTGTTSMNFMTGFYRFSMFAPPFITNNTGVYWQLEDLFRGSGTAGIITGNLPIGSTQLRPQTMLCAVSGGARNMRVNVLYTENAGTT